MSRHFQKLKVKDLKRETKDAISITFEIPSDQKEAFSYEAGQYLTIRHDIDGEDIRRSYSISSVPAEEGIKVTSKKIKGGKMSTFLYENLALGDELEVMPPEGAFTLKHPEKALILFAAGSGITPIISILKDYLQKDGPRAYLFYGNRSEEDIIFKSELAQLQEQYQGKFLVQHFLSSNGERVDQERVKSLVGHAGPGIADYYICGPEGMIQAAKSAIEASGIPSEEVFVEYFSSPDTVEKKERTVVSGSPSVVVVKLDDEEHKIELEDGESILEGAERIGIDPPFSCHSGVCTTCKAKLLSGEVEMENNFGLGQDEIDDGYVLTCIGYPKSAGVKIDWDEV